MSELSLIGKTVKAYNEGARYIVHSGGTRSGKTYSVLTSLIAIAAESRRKTISVVSETYPHLRRGAMRDFFRILGESYSPGRWKATDKAYSFGSQSFIEFFSADNAGKVHGAQRDILFLNEAQNISEAIATHLMVRTAEVVFIDFNPTHRFWAHDLQDLPETAWITSTYRDNEFLSDVQVGEIERRKKNELWWRVYGLGLIGEVEGLIYGDFELVDEMPDGIEVVAGVDFGYSIDPTAVVLVGTNSDGWWVDEVVYKTGLSMEALGREIESLRGLLMYCDSAEPRSIDALRAMGFRAEKADKNVSAGIMEVQSKKIYVTKKSINLIKEIRNYTYKKNKEGKFEGIPAPNQDDHALDALRYAVYSHFRKKTVEKQYISGVKRTYL